LAEGHIHTRYVPGVNMAFGQNSRGGNVPLGSHGCTPGYDDDSAKRGKTEYAKLKNLRFRLPPALLALQACIGP